MSILKEKTDDTDRCNFKLLGKKQNLPESISAKIGDLLLFVRWDKKNNSGLQKNWPLSYPINAEANMVAEEEE